jgi:hypothetical protein
MASFPFFKRASLCTQVLYSICPFCDLIQRCAQRLAQRGGLMEFREALICYLNETDTGYLRD